MCPFTGFAFRSSWRRWLVPRQVPSKATFATVSMPSAPMPRLERPVAGAESSEPPRIRIPVGAPGLAAKKSPFTPTVVAVALTSFCMSVSFSVPTMAPFESAGASV